MEVWGGLGIKLIYSLVLIIVIVITYIITKKHYNKQEESEFNIMLTEILNESFSQKSMADVSTQIVKILKSYYKVEYVTFLIKDKYNKLKIVSTNIKPEYVKKVEDYCTNQLNNMGDSIVKLRMAETGELENKIEASRGIQFSLFANLIYNNNLLGAVLIEGTNIENIEKEKIREEIYSKIFNSTAMVIQNIIYKDNLVKMLSTDQLTGVYNRRYMDEQLLNEIKTHRIKRKTFNIAMLDIDYFKKVNDNYGHQFGDLVLQTVSQYIKNNIRDNEFDNRSNDWIARYGGEEFLIVFAESSQKDIYNKVNRLREGISKLNITDGEITASITVSFGIATFPINGKNIDSLVEKADEALYKSKNTGRNKVTVAK